MVKSTMTEKVPSSGRGGTAAATAQNEQDEQVLKRDTAYSDRKRSEICGVLKERWRLVFVVPRISSFRFLFHRVFLVTTRSCYIAIDQRWIYEFEPRAGSRLSNAPLIQFLISALYRPYNILFACLYRMLSHLSYTQGEMTS